MLGVDPRAARISWTVFLVALSAAVLYEIRGTLLIFTIALLVAYLLAPLGQAGASTPTEPRIIQ